MGYRQNEDWLPFVNVFRARHTVEIFLSRSMRERERERERQRETERERETDRQTDRETETETER